jgi:hypothetical protein
MEASCGGGQSPPWAVAPVGRKKEGAWNYHPYSFVFMKEAYKCHTSLRHVNLQTFFLLFCSIYLIFMLLQILNIWLQPEPTQNMEREIPKNNRCHKHIENKSLLLTQDHIISRTVSMSGCACPDA